MSSAAADAPRDIFLHGALGGRFGDHYRLAIDTPHEAVRALSVQLPGFQQAIRDGHWKIIRGEGDELTERELMLHLGAAPLHIVPVVEGSGLLESGGKIIAGLALAAGAAFFAPSLALALPIGGAVLANAGIGIGLTMALSGASALLSPKPEAANGRGGVDERASFIFNGAENVTQQGGCVPLVFGTFLVGSVVVSAGLTTEQI